jgi:3-deoxy-manno-octulosonate cytidylyltransferase (CMP-KDO synthetase)
MSDPLVLIPARLAATRLPNKPLAEIAGEPMIVHVWRRAMGAGVGPVAVATDAPSLGAPNVVKLVGSEVAPGRFRALYFTRATAPFGDGPLLHHIGLYAYRRRALARFVSLPPSALERRERLEQLRALEAGMRIDAVLVDDVPLGVDTPHDLARARENLTARKEA